MVRARRQARRSASYRSAHDIVGGRPGREREEAAGPQSDQRLQLGRVEGYAAVAGETRWMSFTRVASAATNEATAATMNSGQRVPSCVAMAMSLCET